MAADITQSMARQAIISAGYEVLDINQINEGSNHYVFLVTLSDKKAICKFAKVRKTEENLGAANKDTLFGGILSLEREAYLFTMIKEKTGVPTPEVYGIHHSEIGTFILLECMPGISHKQFMADSGYSKAAFLGSMAALGHDFAHIQNVSFRSFGNIMEHSEIEPSGITNFSDRFQDVISMRIYRCMKKDMFSEEEYQTVIRFFSRQLTKFSPFFDFQMTDPVLVFTDMHAENFFVDSAGKPSGYFDLESAQAAPAALEFYGCRFFLFNFFDKACYRDAERAFFRGYEEAGGKYAPASQIEHEAIDFLAGCRLLELAQSYWGYIDGVRDTWGQTMKELLFRYMETNTIDYMAVGDIWRQRDCQPEKPLLP